MSKGTSPKTVKPDTPPTVPAQLVPLVGVLVGVILFVAGLSALYIVMRSVGLDQGGTCVSGGGPYVVAPGHECESGVFALGYGGALGLLIGVPIFLWSSHRYGGPLITTSASGFSWSGFWAGLGGSFLTIGIELPGASDVGSEFKTVGIVFLVFAFLGLAVAVGPIPFSMQTRQLDYPKPSLGAWVAWLAAIAAAVAIVLAALKVWNG